LINPLVPTLEFDGKLNTGSGQEGKCKLIPRTEWSTLQNSHGIEEANERKRAKYAGGGMPEQWVVSKAQAH